MNEKQLNTEEQIFRAACRVFQNKGYEGARMQEIADEADINKSMLHYYYRSKDKLFAQVYQQQMSQFFPVIIEVLNSDKSLDKKVEEVVDVYYSLMNDNPRLSQFIITEMNHNPQRFKEFIQEMAIHLPEKFFNQINKEIDKGNMIKVDPRQFWISIIGLILFPFHSGTMIQAIFEMDETDFAELLQERKAFLIDFILNGINYNKQ